MNHTNLFTACHKTKEAQKSMLLVKTYLFITHGKI